MNKIAFDKATGVTTGIVLHLVEALDSNPAHEAPRCGATDAHPGYRTASAPADALGIAKRDGVILCGACVMAATGTRMTDFVSRHGTSPESYR